MRATLKANLVFDTADLPLHPGVRGRDILHRYQIFTAGPFNLDLRVERGRQPSIALLVGQIDSGDAPSAPLRDVSVALVVEERTIAQTRTDSFGGFELEYEPDVRMRLALEVPGERVLVVPVERQITRQTDGRRSDPYQMAASALG